jgi:hypothetical protein
MKFFSALCFLLLLGLGSCGKLYLRMKYDVRSFKPRSTTELLAYLEKHAIQYDRLYRISETAFELQSASSYKPDWKEGLRPVQMRAFDSTGTMIMQWAICEGFLDSMNTLQSFPPVNMGPFLPRSLADDLLQYADQSGNVPDTSDLPPHDLCLVVYWSRALGELSLGSVRPVMEYRQRYPEKRIIVLLVSMDPERGWKAGR